MALKNIMSGILGNYSEQSPEKLQAEYGAYLMEGEVIQTGFILLRDVLIITDKRFLSFDKQGVTGKKVRVRSINLFSITSVTCETAGFGLDDSEMTIAYISSPYHLAHSIAMDTYRMEFPKKYQIQTLYKMIQDIAYENVSRINGL